MISCLAELDSIASLAKLSFQMDQKCKPIFLKDSKEPVFDLKDMVHPCVLKTGVDFVPNDTVFDDNVHVMLVTGANMGGKSTLLRQNCIAIILAQLGSFVPAKSFKLTPVDRIFTRIGASDRIVEGKSTFFVEMEETKAFLSESTKNSFAIIDELGRGTSTYDGAAIAYAVLKYILENIKCCSLFATHYHMLIEDFKMYNNCRNYRMTYLEKNDSIKFLYKFREGFVPKSFGINVARMAGIPQEVLDIAQIKSKQMLKEKQNLINSESLTTNINNILGLIEESNDIKLMAKHINDLKLL